MKRFYISATDLQGMFEVHSLSFIRKGFYTQKFGCLSNNYSSYRIVSAHLAKPDRTDVAKRRAVIKCARDLREMWGNQEATRLPR